MKKLALLLFFGMFAFASFAQDKKAEIKFAEASHDFGDITQGNVVEYTFKFKNTGTTPLVLTNVAVTCGCTAPTWPREAILPGEDAQILIKFNSTGKMGVQNKVITVYSNAVNNPERIKIITNVLPKQ